MEGFPWKWVFGASLALLVTDYFFDFVPMYAPAALLILLIAAYLGPRTLAAFSKKDLAVRSIDYVDPKVRDWALKERGIHLKSITAFQEAVRMDGTQIYEIVYADRANQLYRIEVNRMNCSVTRFSPATTVDFPRFSTSDERLRFRHLQVPPREIPPVARPPARAPPAQPSYAPPEVPEEKKKRGDK